MKFKPLSRSAMLTIVFFFGLAIIGVWAVTNVLNRNFSPDKSILGLIGYILTAVLFGLKKENDDVPKDESEPPSDKTVADRGQRVPPKTTPRRTPKNNNRDLRTALGFWIWQLPTGS
jgi:hypothetical protein